MGMREFANHVLAVGTQHNLPVTNLQLQKVMFFALGFYIAENGIDETAMEIYDENFGRWKYGPVVETIYHEYSNFGSENITEDEHGNIDERYNVLNRYIEPLLRQNPFVLVEISHSFESWSKYKNDIIARKNVPDYSLNEIETDFTS